MAYSAILGQTPEIPDPAPPTAAQVSYSNASTSDIIGSNNVQGALDNLAVYSRNLFTSVSNGKNQIASAITDKGVSASGSESFASLAGKIGQIPTPQTPGNILMIEADSQGNFTVPALGKLPEYMLFLNLRYLTETGTKNYADGVWNFNSGKYAYQSPGQYGGGYSVTHTATEFRDNNVQLTVQEVTGRWSYYEYAMMLICVTYA